MSFLRRLFAFLFSKGNKANDGEPEKVLPNISAEPTSCQDGKPKVGKTNTSNPDTRIDKVKQLQGGSSSSKSGDDNTIAPEPACSTGEQVSPPSSSTGLGTTHVQSVPKKDSSEETGSTLIDCNNSENTDKVIDSNISNIILTETPKAVSPARTIQPPLETIKPGYKLKLLPGTLEKISEWDRKCYRIILTTGRREGARVETEKQLREAGIIYDQLIMGISGATRVLINDKKPDGITKTAFAYNLIRNEGIKHLDI